MSAPIHSLLADELNVSEERAKKLLLAMLREVRKRAHREGVRLPDLGTFRKENGQLTFEPTPSLARAVNHRFEGLSSEDLVEEKEEKSDEETDDEGPSTVILGAQSSDWSPIGAASEEEGEDAEDSSEADTEEFQIPAAEEAADTEEFQVPEVAEEEDLEGTNADSSSSDSEDLYPLVEDASESDKEEPPPTETTSTSEEEDSSPEDLEAIWNSEEEPASKPEDTEETPSGSPRPTTSADPESPPERPATSSSESSIFSRFLLPLLLLVLIGGASWYILGQRGVLPAPSSALAGMTTQFQKSVRSIPLFENTSSTPQDPEDEAEQDAPSQGASSASEASTPAPDSDESTSSSPIGIDQEAGGWTIIVASRTDQATAESLVATFRDQFDDDSLPLDVVTGDVNNTTRYRVAVGQYRTHSDVQQAMEELGDNLPEGAWPLRLR